MGTGSVEERVDANIFEDSKREKNLGFAIAGGLSMCVCVDFYFMILQKSLNSWDFHG